MPISKDCRASARLTKFDISSTSSTGTMQRIPTRTALPVLHRQSLPRDDRWPVSQLVIFVLVAVLVELRDTAWITPQVAGFLLTYSITLNFRFFRLFYSTPPIERFKASSQRCVGRIKSWINNIISIGLEQAGSANSLH